MATWPLDQEQSSTKASFLDFVLDVFQSAMQMTSLPDFHMQAVSTLK